MAQLSEWLEIMLGEITRKREELEQARREDRQRQQEGAPAAGERAPDTVTRGAGSPVRRRA